MTTDNPQYQSGTLATPPPGLAVATDYAATGGGGSAHFQRFKLDLGGDGTTIPAVGSVPVGVLGTAQTLGTVQPLAGSVHLANAVTGTVQAFGTSQVLGTVQGVGTFQTLGTVQTVGTRTVVGTVQAHGTTQALGTLQPLAGSVHPAAALPGTSHITGTVQPLAGSVHLASGLPGTVQILGTAQLFGTSQVLGTVAITDGGTRQVLGTASVQGYAAGNAAPAGNPFLIAAVGSSGALTATSQGSVRALWADLSGRLVVTGTVDMPGGTIPGGTVSVSGTPQVLGSVQAVGTAQVLGTVFTVGTQQMLGTVRALPPQGTAPGETFFSTIYTAAANDVTLIAAPSQGTFVRLYDILVSGSAAGTVRILDAAEGTAYGHLHLAANGGWSFNSARGMRSRGTARAVLLDCSAGTWGIMINYALET